MRWYEADVLVAGGGLGGVAAALAALRLGKRVVLTEDSPWLGGQLTSQAVPPDEHPWIEDGGCTRSYRELRNRIRAHYRRNYPLTDDARAAALLNPGAATVSRLCHEPRVAIAAIDDLLAPYLADRQLHILLRHQLRSIETDGDRVGPASFVDTESGEDVSVTADYVLDATELGYLLDLAGVEHVIGAESQADTGELNALDRADPLDQQSITWCFAMDYLPGADYTIDKPANYEFWRAYQPDFWPGRLFSWEDLDPETLRARPQPIFTDDRTPRGGYGSNRWTYRRIFSIAHYPPGRYASDITLVNWEQNDYWLGPVIGVPAEEAQLHWHGSRDLSLSFLYWMQTEAPRHDGGVGYPGLRLRGDITGDHRRFGDAAIHQGIAAHQGRADRDRTARRCRGPLDRGTARRFGDLRRHGRGRKLSDRSASEHLGTQLRRYFQLSVPDSVGRFAAGTGRQSVAGQQEHRHHAYIERLLPVTPGGVEYR